MAEEEWCWYIQLVLFRCLIDPRGLGSAIPKMHLEFLKALSIKHPSIYLSFFLLQFKNLYYFVPVCLWACVCYCMCRDPKETLESQFPPCVNRTPSLSPEPSHELCSGFTVQPRPAENMASPCLSCLCVEDCVHTPSKNGFFILCLTS